jgi:hypothetical protein
MVELSTAGCSARSRVLYYMHRGEIQSLSPICYKLNLDNSTMTFVIRYNLDGNVQEVAYTDAKIAKACYFYGVHFHGSDNVQLIEIPAPN